MEQVVTRRKDDLNPELEADRTVLFSFDGENYEIDLTDKHYQEMRDRFYAYMVAGRKRKVKPKRRRTPPAEAAAIRAFGRENGMPCLSRGRIPAALMQAWQARQS